MYRYNCYDVFVTITVNGKRIIRKFCNTLIANKEPQINTIHYNEDNILSFMEHYGASCNYYISLNGKKLKSFDYGIKAFPIKGIEIAVTFDCKLKINQSIKDILEYPNISLAMVYLLERKIKIGEILKQK